MDLVLFDVDGTLIRSMQDDGECLVASLYEAFGFTDVEAADNTAARLRAESIEFLLPDFRDQDLFHDYREQAVVR